MKKAPLVLLSLLLPLAILAADTTPPPRLTVELRDGSHVVGTAVEDAVRFHSAAMGDLTISWSGIRSVEATADTGAARLTATNGDTFAVQFAADMLPLQTGFGKTELPVKQIRNLKVTSPSRPDSARVPSAGQSGWCLTLELRDGSRLIGKALDEALSFHSATLGDLKLTWAGIRSLEYASATSDVARLTVTNQDVYEVQFASTAVPLETSWGKTEVPMKLIRSIKVAAMGGLGQSPSGLVALWSGEGDANDSVGGCNGQLMNGAGFAPGKVGQAFSLNEGGGGNAHPSHPGIGFGGSGFVLVPASPALNVGAGDGFSFIAWIKPATVSREMLIAEFERVLGTFDGADVGIDFAIQRVNGSGGWCLYANVVAAETDVSHEIVSPPNLLTPGVWQRVALTYDKTSGAAALYLNGAAVAQANLGSFVPKTAFPHLLLGARTTFGSVTNPRSAFAGGLDEIGLYNRALSEAEVREDYEAGIDN